MATYEETKEALEGAIKKWELIYANAGTDEGTDNCPLCELFNDECTGCHRYRHNSTKNSLTIECTRCTEIALNMINYLKSLHPVVDEMFDKTDKRKVWPDTSDIPEF